jgi:hypothetical protein
MAQITFSIDSNELNVFIATIGLGILEAMKNGQLSYSFGIWSLARPAFWQKLENINTLSPELLEIVKEFDELDALNKFNVNSCNNRINEMIKELKEIISQSENDTLHINFIKS